MNKKVLMTLAFSACLPAVAFAAETEAVAQVRLVPAVKAPIAENVTAFGSVTFSPSELNSISLPYAGRIANLYVSVGQVVRNSTKLFEAMPDYSVEVNVQQARHALALAKGELERTQMLAADQLATRSQVANAQKALADANSALSSLMSQGAGTSRRIVQSPYDGIVSSIAVVQGDVVQAGAIVLQIGKTSGAGPAHVVVGVEPSDVSKLKVGQPVKLYDMTRPEKANASLRGAVTAIKQLINPVSRLVDVTIAIFSGDSGTLLLAGMSMRADIEVGKKPYWVVPRSAVLTDERGEYVYQIANGRAHRVRVRHQVENADQYGLEGELQGNLPVVWMGNYVLSEDMQVKEVK